LKPPPEGRLRRAYLHLPHSIDSSEPLTEDDDDWSNLEFGEIVFLEKKGENITRNVSKLQV